MSPCEKGLSTEVARASGNVRMPPAVEGRDEVAPARLSLARAVAGVLEGVKAESKIPRTPFE